MARRAETPAENRRAGKACTPFSFASPQALYPLPDRPIPAAPSFRFFVFLKGGGWFSGRRMPSIGVRENPSP